MKNNGLGPLSPITPEGESYPFSLPYPQDLKLCELVFLQTYLKKAQEFLNANQVSINP